MDSNSVSPMPDTAPMAEFDKSPPTPPEETLPMDDLPPPPGSAGSFLEDEKAKVYIIEEFEKPEPEPEPECGSYEDEDDWGLVSWCEYVTVLVLAALLLIGSLTITIFWIMYYREGFSWDIPPKLQFNLHPVLMVAGFITFSGFSILLFRICRCFRRIYVKLIHTIFHALAIPCVVIGFFAVFEYHNNSKPPIPNFYSMHSWLGCITMGLFALQFAFGFFSFLILLCCEGISSAFRASMVPIHASFGLTTFMLAICTCLTGLTQNAISTLGDEYANGHQEGVVINVLAVVLVALGILISYAVRSTQIRSDTSTVFHAKVMSAASSRASAGPY